MAAHDALPEWAVGVLVCLFGSTLTALGLVLQKHSHLVEAASASGHPTRYYCQRWWLLGFSCYISAQVINMVAMAMTPQVVLSCLGSWTLVCNTVFARAILRESVTSRQRAAVGGLVVATAMVIYNAPRPPPGGEITASNAAELSARFVSPEFEATTALLLGSAASLFALAEGIARTSPKRSARLLATAWCVASAVGTGYTALLFKCIAEILAMSARALSEEEPWRFWETYVVVGVAFSCAPAELHCLNMALQHGEASLVVPMYLALGMLAQLCTGAVFFCEFRWFDSRFHVVSFACSVVAVLTCVVSMAVLQVEDGDAVLPDAESKEDSVYASAATCSLNQLGQPLVSQQLSAGVVKRVSVAGFGAAIECFEIHSLPARRHTDSALEQKSHDKGGCHSKTAPMLRSASELSEDLHQERRSTTSSADGKIDKLFDTRIEPVKSGQSNAREGIPRHQST